MLWAKIFPGLDVESNRITSVEWTQKEGTINDRKSQKHYCGRFRKRLGDG